MSVNMATFDYVKILNKLDLVMKFENFSVALDVVIEK